MFYLVKAATSHMPPGSAIINTASVNADSPSPHLLAYATTKGAIQNFTAGLAQLLADRGIRVNAVAPGPVWTPLIPSTMPPEAVAHFGEKYPMKRPAQPRELAPVYVMLASDEASYVSGTMVGGHRREADPVTGPAFGARTSEAGMAIEIEERSGQRGRRWWYKPYNWPAGGWGSARSLAKSLARERVIASAPPP